jgi:hypothetical protein
MYAIYPEQVLDATTYEPNKALVGQQVQVVARNTTTPYPIYDGAGDPIAGSLVTVTAAVSTPTFYIDTDTPETVYLDWYDAGSGQRGPIDFEEVLRQTVMDARDAAEAALALVQEYEPGSVLSVNGQTGHVTVDTGSGSGGGSVTWGSLTDRPDTFPPSGHSHTRSEISDASALARQILGSATAQEIRQLIGAGTGNGTSNLVLGTTATTAAPGNHTHSQYVDQAQAASIADARIAANGGGSGGGSIMAWIYRSGAYPALPSTKPAGVLLIEARGPVAPSSVPSWVGNGADQVPLDYAYNGGLA